MGKQELLKLGKRDSLSKAEPRGYIKLTKPGYEEVYAILEKASRRDEDGRKNEYRAFMTYNHNGEEKIAEIPLDPEVIYDTFAALRDPDKADWIFPATFIIFDQGRCHKFDLMLKAIKKGLDRPTHLVPTPKSS